MHVNATLQVKAIKSFAEKRFMHGSLPPHIWIFLFPTSFICKVVKCLGSSRMRSLVPWESWQQHREPLKNRQWEMTNNSAQKSFSDQWKTNSVEGIKKEVRRQDDQEPPCLEESWLSPKYAKDPNCSLKRPMNHS